MYNSNVNSKVSLGYTLFVTIRTVFAVMQINYVLLVRKNFDKNETLVFALKLYILKI